VPFHERGRIVDEYFAAMVELWTSESPRFRGKYVSFDDIAFAPKPVQSPHLPIWIAGGAPCGVEAGGAVRFGLVAACVVDLYRTPALGFVRQVS
jgi:alkanesulfonate monooxygenase SsuD/methylene tetrahydromethanopterin reductase-like flavin-dependent oxidoreductase (luciferase family)